MAICALVPDKSHQEEILLSIQHNQFVRKKGDWVERHVKDKVLNISDRLFIFSLIEMIFFCGSFAIFFWLKSRGKLQALTFSNDFIARDESQHVKFGIALRRHYSAMTIDPVDYVRQAVELETLFWNHALELPLPGMNKILMAQYVQYTANKFLELNDLEPLFSVENPFPFAETSSLESKSNFFERKVSEYRNAALCREDLVFTTTEDF